MVMRRQHHAPALKITPHGVGIVMFAPRKFEGVYLCRDLSERAG